MLAISRNRQSLGYELKARNWTQLLARTARLLPIFAVLIGPAQRSWSQGEGANADPGSPPMSADLTSTWEPEPQQSVFVSVPEPIFGPPLANTFHQSDTNMVPSQAAELRVA